MANIGGPLPKKRKLLMEACNSILLYGCEVWGMSLQARQRANKLLSVQRTAALREASAYRTVSAPAIQVISGMIPIDLQVEERMEIYALKQRAEADRTQENLIKMGTMRKWQNRRYLHKMKKCNSPNCIYEEEEYVDDVEHTFFHCKRWRIERDAVNRQVGQISPETIVHKMISDEQYWLTIARYCEDVLRKKKIDLDS
ncbi:uncharacterized protein LOC142242576 [Haematobia irritans]|uniref:uncharacterized protein LOC142242576 n=1 Tax=Haematobia irritans TaxID=7368 RepID=UPI003F4FEBB4